MKTFILWITKDEKALVKEVHSYAIQVNKSLILCPSVSTDTIYLNSSEIYEDI